MQMLVKRKSANPVRLEPVPRLALGIMSGTSADGVSLALASFQGRKIKVLAHQTYPYASSLRKVLMEAGNLKTPGISKLNVTLGNYFADCAVRFIKKSRQKSSKIAVIGSHGHTVWHAPTHTLQIGEPSFIAERTGIPVVADFRMRDIAAGGEGAPLIPFFDDYFFGSGPLRALQNIGGIGNVTLVGTTPVPVPNVPGSKSTPVPLNPVHLEPVPKLAFDTGPGNCLMDWAVQKMTKGKMSYDRGGKIAASGSVHAKAVVEMSRHPYFLKRPPKSTGRELFNASFIPRVLLKERPENLVATLTYFTAHTIYESYQRFLPPNLPEIIVSGGGALNPVLMKLLKKLFAPAPVRTIEEYGIPAQAKEPAAFAFFALRALEGKINHAPSGTGARRACILGKIIS